MTRPLYPCFAVCFAVFAACSDASSTPGAIAADSGATAPGVIADGGSATQTNPDSGAAEGDAATALTYDKDIAPIMEERCVKCHSGEMPAAKLALDGKGWLTKQTRDECAAGKKLKLVDPGNPDGSFLLHVLGDSTTLNVDDDECNTWMPKAAGSPGMPGAFNKLIDSKPGEVATIRAWIASGAK